MGYLNNAVITVDAILTDRGRELLARGDGSFKITQFALSDDEIDYSLYDPTDPSGSAFFGKNIENMLSKNKDPIIVMITGGVDTILAFSYLKQYTDNFKILTYEHIDFTDFICKNWAFFKKRNSSEGFLHFNGSNLILAGGWGDERLLRDPRICNLNFKLNSSNSAKRFPVTMKNEPNVMHRTNHIDIGV